MISTTLKDKIAAIEARERDAMIVYLATKVFKRLGYVPRDTITVRIK